MAEKAVDPKVIDFFTGYSPNFLQGLADCEIDVDALYAAHAEGGENEKAFVKALRAKLQPMLNGSIKASRLHSELINRT